MILYLAVINIFTMDSEDSQTLGVFSTTAKAVDALSEQWNFKEAKKVDSLEWKHIYDGGLTVQFKVVEVELDKAIE